MKYSEAKTVSLLIPAYNESSTIQEVVKEFRGVLPEADIYVYDNNSTDDTAEKARAAGAIVRSESHQGKGNVVRRMFSDIDSDVYVMVDADLTYDARYAPTLIDKLVDENLDMVIGVRLSDEEEAYRRGHVLGNMLLNRIVHLTFGNRFTDMLSGYRVFSKRFVKTFPALSNEFEIETEFSVHALEMKLPTAEVDTHYRARPEGSDSKLSTYMDGLKIILAIARMLKVAHPLRFFGSISILLAIIAFLFFMPILQTYIETGLVPRVPTFIASIALFLLSALSLTSGIILQNVSRVRLETKRLHYLRFRSPGSH